MEVLFTKNLNSDMRSRIDILKDLVLLQGNIVSLEKNLSEFAWDNEMPLYLISIDDFIHVLRKSINAEIGFETLISWANALECRDDLGFENEAIQEILFELASPEINGEITKERLQDIVNELKEQIPEYAKHLIYYMNEYAYMYYSKLVSIANWGNKELAEKYLQKYWLPEQEYLNVWKPIQDKIFIQGKSLPDLIYKAEFEIVALIGGCLFIEEDFKQLQRVMQEADEEYFVIIQHSQDFTEGEPMFRMKFPVNITWEELTSGNYISAVLLEMSYNEYWVFGSKSNWGRYSANDYKKPLDIIGFKSELATKFRTYFRQSKEEQEEIWECLPQEYKERYK